MFIWCDFFLDDFESGRYLKLTPDIDEAFLCESPSHIRDPQVVLSSIEMKNKYENKFTKTFMDMKRGEEVEVYGITFFCPKNTEPNGGNMETLYFNRVELDSSNQITAIVLSSQQDEESSEEFIFKSKVLTDYGRYGGVKLWCVENASLVSGDDSNTYIICTSDIFY